MTDLKRLLATGAWAAPLLSLLAAGPAHAISIRDDVGTAAGGIANYYDSGNAYPNVGSLRRGGSSYCTGTLLDARTVLTATHCFEEGDVVQPDLAGPETEISFSPQSGNTVAAQVQSVRVRPDFRTAEGNLGYHDIALVALASPVTGIAPVRLPSAQPGTNGTVAMVGYGGAFLGSTPQNHIYDGRRRVAFNTLDFVGPGGQLPRDSDGDPMADAGWVVLAVDFDNPDSAAYSSLGAATALAQEGAVVAGDSGGPLFLLQPDGTLVQIGVLAGGDATDVAQFYGAQVGPETAYTGYGDLEIWTNVAAYLDWLSASAFVQAAEAVAGDGAWSSPSHWSGGVVPDNSTGYVAAGGARYFDVTLSQPGTTVLDMDATVDSLALTNAQAALTVPAARTLTTEIGTTVGAGTLNVAGTLSAPWLRVNGGTLGGNGRIATTGGLTQSAGTISPGGTGSIGTLTVAGPFTQTGGVLLAELATGSADRLAVGGGAASMAGAVQVALLGETPPDAGTRFTIVSADSLSAAGLADPAAVGAVTFTLVRGATELAVQVGRQPLARIGADPDQDAVAGALDALRGDPGFEPVFDALDDLPAGQIRQGLEEMGEVSTAAGVTARAGSAQFLGASSQRVAAVRLGMADDPQQGQLALAALSSMDPADAAWALADADTATRLSRPRLAGPVDGLGSAVTEGPVLALGGGSPLASEMGSREQPWGFWLQPYGTRTLRRGDDPGSRYNASLGGMAAGLDYRLRDNLVVGVSLGYARADIGYLDNDSASRMRSYQAGLYAGWWSGPWSAEAGLGLALNRYKNRREISFGTIDTAAEGRPDGREASGYVEGRYRYALNLRGLSGLELVPSASLQALQLHTDGYTETGAGVLNLTVGADDVTSVKSGLGLALAWPVVLGDGTRLRPELRGRWLHEFGDTDVAVDARFATAGGAAFQVSSDSLGRDAAVLGAGLEAQVSPSLGLAAGYDAQLQSGLTVHAVTAKLRMAF